MRRNPEFLLREVAGTLVIVPVGAAVSTFPGMVTLNATGAYLWELLEQTQSVESLTQALMERYDVDVETATKDVNAYIAKLTPIGALI